MIFGCQVASYLKWIEIIKQNKCNLLWILAIWFVYVLFDPYPTNAILSYRQIWMLFDRLILYSCCLRSRDTLCFDYHLKRIFVPFQDFFCSNILLTITDRYCSSIVSGISTSSIKHDSTVNHQKIIKTQCRTKLESNIGQNLVL